jgi:RNA polymerase sigma-70 factor (ECF subfamily)
MCHQVRPGFSRSSQKESVKPRLAFGHWMIMRIVSALGGAPALRFGLEDVSTLGHALVARARTGDSKAFRLIFERHAPAVRRFLFDLLRDDEAADEGTQETFVRAHGRLGSLRDEDKLLPWLFGIARHVFHEHLRARRARPHVPDREMGEMVDHQPTPEGALMGREADRMLSEALALLPEERRAALLLRIDHGLEYEEIRLVMGWSLAKVKNEIHRARVELRVRLARYVGGRDGA